MTILTGMQSVMFAAGRLAVGENAHYPMGGSGFPPEINGAVSAFHVAERPDETIIAGMLSVGAEPLKWSAAEDAAPERIAELPFPHVVLAAKLGAAGGLAAIGDCAYTLGSHSDLSSRSWWLEPAVALLRPAGSLQSIVQFASQVTDLAAN